MQWTPYSTSLIYYELFSELSLLEPQFRVQRVKQILIKEKVKNIGFVMTGKKCTGKYTVMQQLKDFLIDRDSPQKITSSFTSSIINYVRWLENLYL